MNKILFLFTLFCSATSYSSTLVKIGNETISHQEFKKSYQKALERAQVLNKLPTKKEHLEDMIRFKVGLLEAKRINLKKNPLVKKSLDLELYKGLLEVKLGKLVEKIKVSTSEMKRYYKNNPNFRSSHVLIKFPINASIKQKKEAEKRALKLYKKILTKKKKWEVYTRLYSDDQVNKNIAGDMGYHNSKTIDLTYYKTLKKLKMGQISPPVQGLFGYHIIKKTGELSYAMTDKNILKLAVFDMKRFKLFDKYLNSLKKRYKVSILK